ncbi:MAG: hypothetical protein IH957_09000, partial [Chloroflexi bacterium]|nr:hypothetical protein [Chloroflexota bacterium]
MARALINSSFRNSISKAKRRFVSREVVGALLWAATIIVVYGTLPLPFVLHMVLVLAWLMGSGLAFMMVARDNQREAQAIFEDNLQQINNAHSDIVLQMATYSE